MHKAPETPWGWSGRNVKLTTPNYHNPKTRITNLALFRESTSKTFALDVFLNKAFRVDVFLNKIFAVVALTNKTFAVDVFLNVAFAVVDFVDKRTFFGRFQPQVTF
jgi:hypothetical protein